MEIIECFTHFIDNPEVKIVLQKGSFSHKPIKSMKHYKWILWYVYKSNKYPLFTIQSTLRSINDIEEERNMRFLRMELIQRIFHIISDKELFKTLTDGSYKGIIQEGQDC